jgi:hypothetical protein
MSAAIFAVTDSDAILPQFGNFDALAMAGTSAAFSPDCIGVIKSTHFNIPLAWWYTP